MYTVGMIRKSYKYRIYPNKEQRILAEKHFGCCRFVYNWGLGLKIETYTKENNSLSFFDLSNRLTKLKNTEEFSWLNEVNAQSLHMSLRNLDNAYTRFFKDKKGFPKFKSKKTAKKSCQFSQGVNILFEENKIKLPKFGKIKAILHRPFEGKVKTTTLPKTSTGKYYVSVLVETPEELPVKPEIKSETTVGIDLGLKEFAIISNGDKVDNPRHLRKSEKRLKKSQRALSRKKKGSNNRTKARIKLSKRHEKISNQRKDFHHKLSHKLTHTEGIDTIALESLNVPGMTKNHCLAKSVCDAGWSQFVSFLEYKAEWYDKNIIRIGRFEPSSKLCSVCGYIKKDLTLGDRVWQCPTCKTKHDRDINAAINIKNFALHPQNKEPIRSGRPKSQRLQSTCKTSGVVKRQLLKRVRRSKKPLTF